MKKRALFIVLSLSALLSVSAAMADRPVGGLVRRDSHPSRHTLRADSRFSLSLDKSSYTVEEEITVSVNIPENYCYYLYLGVFDDTYTDGEPDYLFVREAITDPVVTYDLIYTPGQYVFYVDVYKDNTRVYILEAPFTVAQSESVNKMDQIITEVVNDCQKETEFETVLSLHNWILDHCSYDKTYTYYSAESLFINGSGVCNSYSRAFHLLLQAAGIPSRRVVGWANEKTDDNGHAWNAVCIEGIWHLFDCTWDDTDDTGDGYWRYRWCGLPDDLMTEHIVDNYVGGIVTCSSLESNYFVHTGAWQEECGLAAAQMTDQLDEGFHRFVIEPDRTFDKGNPEIETYVNNRIAAAGLSATVWTDIHDDPCQGTFTAEMSSPTITGQFIGSGLLTLPSGTETLEEEAFAGTAANYVVINDGCTKIASGAFRDSKIWEITIPQSVTDIAEDIFSVPGVFIIAPAGSPAADWAADYGYPPFASRN